MKICLISGTAYQHAGLGRIVLNVANELSKKDHEIGYVVKEGDCKNNVLFIEFNSRNPFKQLLQFFKFIFFAKQFDLLLCFDILPAGFYTLAASVILRKKYYLHCVGTYSLFNQPQWKNWLMEKVMKNAEEVFILSTVVKKYIEKSNPKLSFSKEPIILPPGVETEMFYKTEEKSELIISPYIITVGAVKARKGHDLSLEAFGKISNSYPNLKYVIVGDLETSTDFYKKIATIIDVYKIQDKVIFLQGISDNELRKLYSNAEFFVMTSRTTPEFIEGFGIVYLEAALCGLTSIGAKETGAEDAIINSKTGILTNPDPDNIADSIRKFLDNKEFKNRLSDEAGKNARKYSWENIVKKYLDNIKV